MFKRLKLQDFRCYKTADFSFNPGVNLITGPNGSGKTSILEALYLISGNHSFRSDYISVIKNNASGARVKADFSEDAYDISIDHATNKKIVKKNGRHIINNWPTMVIFEPDMLKQLSGSPDLRRKWVDSIIATTHSDYTKTLNGFKRALRQRNALLTLRRFSKSDVFVWDVKLAEYGAIIAKLRRQWIKVLNDSITDVYRDISGTKDVIHIEYATQFEGDYGSQYLKALNDRLNIDIERGFTSRGPHREDIVFYYNNHPVQAIASRGEIRSIYMACKFIEQDYIQSKTNSIPILLLDDVFAELDDKHKRHLLALNQNNQVFITSVDENVTSFGENVTRHKVSK